MRRIGLIRDRFLSKEELYNIVVYLCRSEKRNHWTFSMYRQWNRFLGDLDGNLDKIYNDLKNQCYVFHPFNIFVRYENGKKRIIYASGPEDQIVDNVLDHALKYVFMERKKIIHPNCYGSIKGKGQHELRTRVIRKVRGRRNLWAAVCDTHHYYPTIKHDIMMSYLKEHIKDSWCLWLCEETIKRMPGTEGMALGLASSNILGHVYHAAVDWSMIVEYGVRNYYRFCDDKIMIDDDPKFLHSMVRVLRGKIEGEMGQGLKPNWKVVWCGGKERFEFLGAWINSENARLKTPSRRRIEGRFKKELRLPFDIQRQEDRDRIQRSWAGVRGGLKGLSINNLIRYWSNVSYPEYFKRLKQIDAYKDQIKKKKTLERFCGTYNPVENVICQNYIPSQQIIP